MENIIEFNTIIHNGVIDNKNLLNKFDNKSVKVIIIDNETKSYYDDKIDTLKGRFAKYNDVSKIKIEKNAWKNAVVEKYENN